MIDLVLKRVFEKGFLKFEIPPDTFTLTLLTGVLTKCKEKHGDYVQVSISTPKRKRTLNENSLFHSQCQQICQYTGEDMETVKMYIKECAVSMGYRTKYSELTKKHIPISSADSTVEECAMLIEQAFILAGELNIVLRET